VSARDFIDEATILELLPRCDRLENMPKTQRELARDIKEVLGSRSSSPSPSTVRRGNTKRRPYKPAVDTICDLNAFSPGSVFTVAEFRKNARSPWYHNDPAEEAQFFKWAKRYGLVEDAPGRRYRLTVKGTRVAREACHR
jgi:hypothetical protein